MNTQISFLILIGWNITVFFIYGKDKYSAIRNKRRISERRLLTSALLMGGLGAFLGMLAFNHKTRNGKFKVLVPVFVILNFLSIYAIYTYIGEVRL